MTNLKRALSLVLVLALALSMVVMGTSAASFTDVKTSYAYSTEVQFLSDLGVLTGYSDGSYKPEGIVTRAEAAAVIYRMLSGKTSAGNYEGDTKFADVTNAHWASGYVNFCVELGVVAGYPDGNFYPDKTLTYAEYTTMLVRALGLDKGKDPAYPFGYIALASVEGINLAVDLSASDSCNRGAVAKLTYNSILDATYARIANSIYVTEKPTIAKNVLKLESAEGTLTSTGKYDFIGASPVGDDKFRLSNVTATSRTATVAIGGNYTGEFEVPVTSLGYNAKIWYKPDAATASGDKVYAVILKDATVTPNAHIGLKGNLDSTKHEITYVVGDEDKTYKLSDTCKFVTNNEYVGTSTASDTYADTYYPGAYRAWFPIAYKFIDNDKDGKYDFVTRTIYGFAKVANMTSSKLQLEGQISIDRKDDAGDAYAWDAMLKDIAVDDYVMYTADGAVAMNANPSFNSSLYKDTKAASFVKIAKSTGTLETIIDGDKFVFGGKTFRKISTDAALNPDLLAESELGKEYEYYALTSFGIIAKSELLSPSSGKYLVVKAKEGTPPSLGNNFDISAINEAGDEDVYTVKGSTSNGLTVVNKTSSALVAPFAVAANRTEEGPLTYGNITVGDFYEYTLDSTGKISTLKKFVTTTGTIAAGENGYSNTSKIIKATNGAFLVDDATLVYVKAIKASTGTSSYKVYTGGFPKTSSFDDLGAASVTNLISVDYKTSSGTNKTRAIYVDTTSETLSGSSSNSGVAGYLRSAAVEENDGKWSYKYTIAYGGEESKVFYSKSVDSFSDLAGMLVDEKLPQNRANMGGVVTFDIKNDGTISNMIEMKTKANFAVSGDKKYYGTNKVVNINTSDRVITLAPLTGAAVTAGARLTKVGNGIATTPDPVLGTSVNVGLETAYRYDANVNVYVFDWNTTDNAGVKVETIGSVQKSATDNSEIYMVSFAYDDDDFVITDIFFNKNVFKSTATPVVPPVTPSDMTYYNGATAVTSYTTDTATAVGLDVKLANTSTTNNISIAAGGITGQIINNTTGVVTAVAGLNAGAMVALPGNTITLGSITNTVATPGTYTVIINAVAGSTTYTKQLALTITATAADVTAANTVIASITALGATPTSAAVTTTNGLYTALTAAQKALVTNSATLLTFVADQTAATATTGLITTANGSGTNTDITAARVSYDALSTWGKTVVTNYATLTGLESAIAAAKTTLANNITAAQTLYTAQIARLGTFTPVEVAAITAEDATQPMAYNTALATLNTAIAAANAVDPTAGAATAASLTTAAGTMATATTTANTAKTAFDGLAAVIASGK